jgi:hypothetical protein
MTEEVPTPTNNTDADRPVTVDILKRDTRFPHFPQQALLVSELHFRGDIDYRYGYFFQFLRVSPSYLRAHEVATGKISRNEVKIVDFELVEETYKLFENVYNINFWRWYIERARPAFAQDNDVGNWELFNIRSGRTLDFSEFDKIQRRLEFYLHVGRLVEGNPPVLGVAIPTSGKKTKIRHQLNEVFDEHFARASASGYGMKKSFLAGVHKKTLEDAWDTLAAKINEPSKKLPDLVPIKPSKKPSILGSKSLAVKRRLAGIIASRHLRRAHIIAENAARGRFPQVIRVNANQDEKFNYKLLAAQQVGYELSFREHRKDILSVYKQYRQLVDYIGI